MARAYFKAAALAITMSALAVATPSHPVAMAEARSALSVDDIHQAGKLLLKLSKDEADTALALKLLLTAADQGHAGAALEIGTLYLDGGRAVKPDPVVAKSYLERAVAGGLAEAFVKLGNAMVQGRGLPSNPAKGVEYLLAAADRGSADAAIALAEVYLKGAPNLPSHPGKARIYLDRAVSGGNERARFVLGRALVRGDGLPADPPEGIAILKSELEGGRNVGGVAFELGSFYLMGGQGIAGDPQLAAEYLDQAMANGYSYAAVVLARALIKGEGLPSDQKRGIDLLEKQIEDGKNVGEAALELGTLYLNGADGIRPNGQKARAYLEQAASAGQSNALVTLARAMIKGDGVPADVAAGVAVLEQQMAVAKHVGAIAFELGSLYLKGTEGLAADPTKAKAYLEHAAASGHGYAPVLLGLSMAKGEGLPLDVDAGVAILDEQIDKGASAANAANELGLLFLSGSGTVPRDPIRARRYLEKAIAGGHESAPIVLGRALVRGDALDRDIGGGVAMLEVAASAGGKRSAEAQAELGKLYLDGSDGLAADPMKAKALLERAAEAGNAEALISLGSAFLTGSFGAADGQAALTYFERARASGAQRATVVAARVYLEGQGGVEKDVDTGMRLLAEAAEEGSAPAIRELISIYTRGVGKDVRKSPQRARKLLKSLVKVADATDVKIQSIMVEASEGGSRAALKKVGELFIELPNPQRVTAARQVFWVNQNAAVYVVQILLKSSGIYAGALNGLLTQATIDAIRQACSQGSVGRCGPLVLHVETMGFVAANFS